MFVFPEFKPRTWICIFVVCVVCVVCAQTTQTHSPLRWVLIVWWHWLQFLPTHFYLICLKNDSFVCHFHDLSFSNKIKLLKESPPRGCNKVTQFSLQCQLCLLAAGGKMKTFLFNQSIFLYLIIIVETWKAIKLDNNELMFLESCSE